MNRFSIVFAAFWFAVLFFPAVRGQDARWVKTHSWSGYGTKQTEMFWVAGSRWRLRYYPSGEGLFQIAVYDEANELLDFATDQNRPFPLRGFASLKGSGRRYLGITGINTSWRVVVEQYVTRIEEWHLLQLLGQPSEPLVKIGTWTGEEGSAKYTFRIPEGSWQIVCTQSDPGLLQVEVTDTEGFVALAANGTLPGESVSWVHKAGTFTIRVVSDAPAWQIDVLAEP